MSRLLRTVSHFAMQSGIAAANIAKENDHGLWMRREKVHGFRGYGQEGDHVNVRVPSADVERNSGAQHERETRDRSGDSADAAEDRLTK